VAKQLEVDVVERGAKEGGLSVVVDRVCVYIHSSLEDTRNIVISPFRTFFMSLINLGIPRLAMLIPVPIDNGRWAMLW